MQGITRRSDQTTQTPLPLSILRPHRQNKQRRADCDYAGAIAYGAYPLSGAECNCGSPLMIVSSNMRIFQRQSSKSTRLWQELFLLAMTDAGLITNSRMQLKMLSRRD